MGIPEFSNIEKRNVAKYLLKNESILGGIYFTLPNGDVYLGEPYSAQDNSLDLTLLIEIGIKELLK
jgi:hypothetical protein